MTIPQASMLLKNVQLRCEEIDQHLRFHTPWLVRDPLHKVLEDLDRLRVAWAFGKFPSSKKRRAPLHRVSGL